MSFVLVPFPLLSSPNCCVSSVTETPSVDEDIMGWKGLMTSIITFYGAGKNQSSQCPGDQSPDRLIIPAALSSQTFTVNLLWKFWPLDI